MFITETGTMETFTVMRLNLPVKKLVLDLRIPYYTRPSASIYPGPARCPPSSGMAACE